MGSTVQALDKSGWSVAAHDRGLKSERWAAAATARAEWEAGPDGLAYAEALAAHPLRRVIDEHVGDEELKASTAHAPWLLKTWDSGNGLHEAFASRREANPRATAERAIRRDLAWMVPRGLGNREKSVANAAQRAKQEVRRLCKRMRVNALWTLTYKANVQDRDLPSQATSRATSRRTCSTAI